MGDKTFAIGNIRPPFHAASLLLRWTENCPWNRCNFCTLYRGGRFRVRSLEEIKADIDVVCYYRDLILERLRDSDPRTVRRMGDISASISREEKHCYYMVLNWIVSDKMKTVFLQDANTMIMKKDQLREALCYLRRKLPQVETVSCYGRADTLARLSAADFRELKEAGLNMIHSGFESGCDQVLALLNKGTRREQEIDCGLKIKEAGITYNVFYMPGAGGRALSEQNGQETAAVVNAIEPDFLRIRTFVVKPGSPMWELARAGRASAGATALPADAANAPGAAGAPEAATAQTDTQDAVAAAADTPGAAAASAALPTFSECSDLEKVREIRSLVAALDERLDTYVISDHIINLLSGVEGFVRSDKEKILSYIDRFLALPQQEQKEFQLARRMCVNVDYDEMALLPENYRDQIRSLIRRADTAEKWEETLRYYLRKYI